MLRFDSFQREILDTLESTGRGYLLGLVYGCGARFPDLAPDAVLRRTIASICGLMQFGMVGAFRERDGERVRISANEVMRLFRDGAIGWLKDEERWHWNNDIGGRVRVAVFLPHWDEWHPDDDLR